MNRSEQGVRKSLECTEKRTVGGLRYTVLLEAPERTTAANAVPGLLHASTRGEAHPAYPNPHPIGGVSARQTRGGSIGRQVCPLLRDASFRHLGLFRESQMVIFTRNPQDISATAVRRYPFRLILEPETARIRGTSTAWVMLSDWGCI